MTIKSMDANELKKTIDSGEKIVLIDCREQSEWDAGHIKEAVFMPLSNFDEEMKKLENLESKDTKLVLQCRSGKRSMTACKLLEENGFTDLTNLEGGILGWLNEGYETEL